MKLKVIFGVLFVAVAGLAQTNEAPEFTFPSWSPLVRGGSVYYSPADVNGGGSFSVNRYFIEGGLARMWSTNRFISVSGGFGQDDYRFEGVAVEPWNNVDNYRAGLFAQWALDEKWTVFIAPSIRSYGEPGVDMDDALTASGFGGFTYKFSDSLSVGPGIAVLEQIRDDTLYLPILLIDWAITDRLSLNTGGGLAATAGPGLSLNYEITKKWQLGVTGRYERKRFLLNSDGYAPDGVGEDESVPLILGVNYVFYPGGFVGAIFGYNFYGKIEVENAGGHEIRSEEYDAAPLFGFISAFRF